MRSLSIGQVEKALAALGRARFLPWNIGNKMKASGAGSEGTYDYYLVGSQKTKSKLLSKGWAGGCFNCWRSIPPHHQVQTMYYQNVLPRKTIPRGSEAFLRSAWDTVIRAPFYEFLPEFNELRKTERLAFDVTENAWMEASLYWRLARIFNECMDMVRSTGILRFKYPDAPAPVLLTAASMGRVSLAGYEGDPIYQTPNNTTHTYGDFLAGMAMVRNWEWAERTGRWDVTELSANQDYVGPFSRHYWGHNLFWFGEGRNFKINTGSLTESQRERMRSSRFAAYNENRQQVLDDMIEVFIGVYERTKDRAPAQHVHVEDLLMENERYATYLRRAALPERLY